MKVGIGLDDWKLPIFRKGLTKAGYSYEDAGELAPDTTALTVETDDLLKLKVILEECQRECAAQGQPGAGS